MENEYDWVSASGKSTFSATEGDEYGDAAAFAADMRSKGYKAWISSSGPKKSRVWTVHYRAKKGERMTLEEAATYLEEDPYEVAREAEAEKAIKTGAKRAGRIRGRVVAEREFPELAEERAEVAAAERRKEAKETALREVKEQARTEKEVRRGRREALARERRKKRRIAREKTKVGRKLRKVSKFVTAGTPGGRSRYRVPRMRVGTAMAMPTRPRIAQMGDRPRIAALPEPRPRIAQIPEMTSPQKGRRPKIAEMNLEHMKWP